MSQAIALAAARWKADQRARLRERYGGPPLDPVVVARAAWSALADEGRWGPEWSGSPTDRALIAMRTAAPEADEVLGEVALRAAIARRLQDVLCSWCLVPEVAEATGLPEPPLDAAHARLLGAPCPTCLGRMRDQILDPVLASVPARRAAPSTPLPARTLAASAAARSAAGHRAPTGVIWAAGRSEPPAVTAALHAAARPQSVRRVSASAPAPRPVRSATAAQRPARALRGRRP